MLNVISGLLSGAGAPASTTAYESIQTTTLSSSQATITFSSIPSTYKHLQIRILARSTNASSSDNVNLTYNGSSANYYAYHQLYGTGSGTAFSNTSNATTFNQTGYITGNTATASAFGAVIIDILDYANTSKNKVVRTFTGNDSNGNGLAMLRSGLWIDTSAISSISLTAAGNYDTYSSFALYGIKG